MMCLHPRTCLLGCWWQHTIIRGSNPPKKTKMGVHDGYVFSCHTGNIIKSQYLRRQISDLNQIFMGQLISIVDFVGGPEWQNSNTRWRTAAILENVWNVITHLPVDQFGRNLDGYTPSSPHMSAPPWCGCHGNRCFLATAHWTHSSYGRVETEHVIQFCSIPFIDNGRTRRPLTPIKYINKTVSK